MAYAFDRILNAMQSGEQDQNQPNQQNIFNQYRGSSGGEIGPSGGAGGGVAGATAPTQAQTANTAPTAGASQVMQRNQGRTQSPVNVGQLAGRIQGAKTSLQQEANQYLENAAAPYAVQQGEKPSLKEEDKTALRGWAFQKPWEKNNAFIEKFQGGVRRVDPLDLKTDTNFADDLSEVVTPAGLQRTLRASGDPMVSAGEAALDARLLFGNQGFQQDVQNARSAFNDLSALDREIQTTYRDRAQEAADKGFKTWQEAATGSMDDIIAELTRDAMSTEDMIESAFPTYSAQDLLPHINKASSARPDLSAFIQNPAISNPTSIDRFIQKNDPAQYDWRSYLADENASAFNKIMTALGRADRANPMTEAFASQASGVLDDKQLIDFLISDAEARKSAMPKQQSRWGNITAEQAIADDKRIIDEWNASVRNRPQPQVSSGAIMLPDADIGMPPAVAAAMERQARREGRTPPATDPIVAQNPNTIRGGQIAVGPSSGPAPAQPARQQSNETRSSVVTNPTFPSIQDILRAPSRIFGR